MSTKPEDEGDPIASYTKLPGLHRTFKVEVSSFGIGRVWLEGHDISHLIASYEINTQVNDSTRVTLELVGLKIG